MFKPQVRSFQVPKEGSLPEQCEDAWAMDEGGCRVAIADGASDAFESRLWARALVDGWVSFRAEVDGAEALERWLKGPIEVWTAGIHWERLPWYSLEKARRGAYATFLGLDLDRGTLANPASALNWRAVAVGDCCLIQARSGDVVQILPIERSRDFGTTPDLISTRAGYNARSLRNLTFRKGECRPGDVLVLATDAMAAWLLHEAEEGRPAWPRLPELTDGELTELVREHRAGRQLRNDDVTMILVRVQGCEAEPDAMDGSRATIVGLNQTTGGVEP